MDSAQIERYRSLLQDKRNDLTQRVRSARSSETEPHENDTPDLGDRAINIDVDTPEALRELRRPD